MTTAPQIDPANPFLTPSGIDWFGPSQVLERGRPRPRNTFYHQQIRSRRGQLLPVEEWVMELRDLSAGMGIFYNTDWRAFPNFYMTGTEIDASVPGYLQHSQAMTSSATPDPNNAGVGLHALYFTDRVLYWAAGSLADKALIKETSATDPIPVAVTYTPTSAISHLGKIVIGGVSTAARMAICRRSNVIDLHTTPGTSAATMHADTSGAWWICQTSLPGRPILIQAGNSIYNNLNAASGTGDAVTAVVTSIPQGGFLLRDVDGNAEFKLQNHPWRVYFAAPKEQYTTGVLSQAILFQPGADSTVLCDLYSINQNGTDLQPFPSRVLPNGIIQAAPVNNKIIATDSFRVTLMDGENEEDLHIFDDVPQSVQLIDSAWLLRCCGFIIRNTQAYAIVAAIKSVTNAIFWLFKLNWESKRWHIVSTRTTLASAVDAPILAGSSYPWSWNTGFFQSYHINSSAWFRQYLNAEGDNPYITLRRATSGSGGNSFDDAGQCWLPIIDLPDGLSRYPNCVHETGFGGDVWAGGSGASAVFNWATDAAASARTDLGSSLVFTNNESHTVGYGDPPAGRVKRYPQGASFNQFWPRIDITRGSTAQFTVNGLPWTIKGYTNTDGVARTPEDIAAMRAA